MKNILFLSLLLLVSKLATAADFSQELKQAEEAYNAGQYEEAISNYEKIASQGYEAFELYYNLGNAYYKSENYAAAILNYERAKKLDPDQEDLLFNLSLAQEHTVDKFDKLPELSVAKWYKSFINAVSSNGWSIMSMITFVVFLAGLSIFLFFYDIQIKKIAIWVTLVFFIFSGTSFVFAWQQKKFAEENLEAIVFEPSVTVKSMPDDNGTRLFVIHEGTKVKVMEIKENWKKIKLSDGNVGWLKGETIQEI
ncbi:tetratricopeptide repeat protein [Flexithrix dorotheae]|uniref:tetratricopeptide repeat protein n=1 Tax=Flexithrix dorotheae TaxID=70993 RepID=UPI0003730DF2|nr:tetratricopeptide repeat protein [Flexithrix dorotheae]